MTDETSYTVTRGTYHAVAKCQDCSWGCQDYNTAEQDALEHCLDTGHRVYLEVGELIDRAKVYELFKVGEVKNNRT